VRSLDTCLSRNGRMLVIAVLADVAILALCWHVLAAALNAVYLEMGCPGDDSPTRTFLLKDLLLDESAFPQGWHGRDMVLGPDQRLRAEQIGRFFYNENGGATQEVYRFSSGTRCAGIGFQKKTAAWFAPAEGWGPWTGPSDLTYQSPVADQFRLACAASPQEDMRLCQAVAQHEEYLVRFHAYVSPQSLSVADLEAILVAIDERMALYLGKGTQ